MNRMITVLERVIDYLEKIIVLSLKSLSLLGEIIHMLIQIFHFISQFDGLSFESLSCSLCRVLKEFIDWKGKSISIE